MKYLDALFVALYRRLPHDVPRIMAILALGLFANQLTAVLLGRLISPGFVPPKLVVLLLMAANWAGVAHRYRPSRRPYYLAHPGLPAARPVHAAAYLVLSILLCLFLSRLLPVLADQNRVRVQPARPAARQ